MDGLTCGRHGRPDGGGHSAPPGKEDIHQDRDPEWTTQAGADITLEDMEGHTAAHIGEQYSHRTVADTIRSPREKFRPEFPVAYMEFLAASAQVGGCPSPHLP